MGVGGTAMAALAGMLVDAGHRVTGSDKGRVYPPMSDYLARLGIEPMEGYRARNLDHRPDLVVVGNVIRAEYEEAQALLAGDLPFTSFPSLLGMRFLQDTRNLVVAGTHGKTTTTALLAYLLEAAGKDPGFLVGGVMANFDRTARAGGGSHFAIEGDEYDTAFFDKGPKFLHYRPTTAILTSIEFDHADIYRDLDHCMESFRRLVAILPAGGCLVARWDSDTVAEVAAAAQEEGRELDLRRYGPGQDWDGRIEDVDTTAGTMRFSVLHEGRCWGTFESIMVGEHNLYNQVACVAALDREGLTPEQLAPGFSGFRGIKRRQEVLGEPGGVTVIDDFAHHPTAVRVTLDALRMRFGGRRLWAIFEPRSNTSRRNVFQDAYADAFGAADIVVIAPPQDLERIPVEERMDAARLVADLRARGLEAWLWGQAPDGADPALLGETAVAEDIAARVVANAMPRDVVAVLSNGGFGGLHGRLLAGLASSD
ncbi:MAG: UDP-N-acetylmuramate:L-alanyl-gamma-D-glutamyl-meso-diaminopimelate ligase [Alphaproteobacteria bacterium]|nr:UDP-N-acetylmuramate:L-alanyl-gamma-D-glutamyl-meso-diaminopimelate ligase [Alphaproteobacteria bacterium]